MNMYQNQNPNQNQNLYQNQDNPYGNIVYGQPYTDNNNQYINTSNPNPNPVQFQAMQISKPTEPDTLGHLEDGLLGQARKKFIYKVYLILTIQLAITTGLCFVSFYVPAFLEFQVFNQWLMWVCFSLMIVSQIIIFCFPAGRRHPINLILLLIFTLCQAYFVSFICAIVAKQNSTNVVIVAAVMTLCTSFINSAIVLVLTLYAIFTPTDFTVKWGIIFVVLMAMLMLGIFSIILWSPFLNNLYCCLGVILFGIYLVIDTQLVIGGRRLEISLDDYVVGALILYIDIIQIFLYLLRIFGRR